MAKYKLVRIVGEGANAVSYLALDEQNRQVLVKRFKTAFYKQESTFKREVDVLRTLNHPQIPAYIDSYVQKVDGRSLPHIVQEYVVGESLDHYIQTRSVTQEEIMGWIEQLLHILSYLHSINPPVIHRDIKPNNILLSEGRLILIDFGLAVDDHRSMMGHTLAAGTLGYQAPEQING